MTRSWTVRGIVLGLAVVGLGVAFLAAGAPASADTPGVAAATAITAAVIGGEEAAYVGSGKCKMCHRDEYKSWAETTHATSFDILKPGERAEAKAKYELDAEKDYTTDQGCLACHVVGAGKKGGYEALEDEKETQKMAKTRGHVGCESCHGPGSGYVELHKAIKKAAKEEGRTYTWSEMEEAGMVKITAETCTCCHNDKSPTYEESKKFDFEAMKEKGAHEMRELQFREG